MRRRALGYDPARVQGVQRVRRETRRWGRAPRSASAESDLAAEAGVYVTIGLEGEREYTIDGWPVHRDLVFRQLARHWLTRR